MTSSRHTVNLEL